MELPKKNTSILLSLHKAAFSAVLIICCSVTSLGQSTAAQLEEKNLKNFSEELYVSTDREIYLSGEKLLLKIFSFNRLTHKPSSMSKVAYVSLLDENNSTVLQVKIGLDIFSGSGQVMLPDTIRTGNYYLCTCTRWMQNSSPDLFSYKKISVINPYQRINRIGIPAGVTLPDNIEFYPESGSITAGKMSTVGFRCLDKNSFPVEITGFITDSENNTLCDVKSDRNGCGLFSINPSGTGKLYLVTHGDTANLNRFELPPVYDSGLSIHLTTDLENHSFRIKVLRSNGLNLSDKDLFLVYSPVSFTPLMQEINLFKSEEIILEQSSLPSGLATITIVDDNGHEYAKRWVYNNKADDISYEINPGKSNFLSREKVKVDIVATDIEGRPVESDLVVSVIKSFSAIEKSEAIQETIQVPGIALPVGDSIFSDINRQLILFKANDDLLKPQGINSVPVYMPEPDGHIISGRIKSGITGEPLIKESIAFSIVGKTAKCKFTDSDNQGNFTFITGDKGIHEIVIQPLSEEFENYYVELDNPYPLLFSRLTPERFFIDTVKLTEINKAIISSQVKSIYEPFLINEKEKEGNNEPAGFYGKSDYTTKISRYIELISLKEVFKEIVPGVFTETKKNKTYISLLLDGQVTTGDYHPLVLVDGVPVVNHERVLRIPPKKIEQIDVMTSKYYVSSVAINGIVDITTVRGNLSDIDFSKPLFRQEFESLQKKPVFISPDYTSPSQKESRIPDFRNTLYWNADIRTNKNGKASVEFFTSDEAGTYVIVVEGFSTEGSKGRATATMTVTR